MLCDTALRLTTRHVYEGGYVVNLQVHGESVALVHRVLGKEDVAAQVIVRGRGLSLYGT